MLAIGHAREAVRDVVINGTRIPKGTSIELLPAVLHHHPKIWGPNADQFDPDRWDRDDMPRDPHSLAAFWAGPRQCIGRVFALIEFKCILIEVLGRFDFEAVGNPDDEVELVNPSAVLRPKNGMKMRVSRPGKG